MHNAQCTAGCCRKKSYSPVELVQLLTAKNELSTRQACRAIGIARSLLYYQARSKNDERVIEAVTAYMAKNPRHGLLVSSFKLEQQLWGKTVLWRIYCNLNLNLPRRGKKRLPERIREPLEVPLHSNYTWSADFMSYSLWSGRRFRTLNVLDDYNRQALRIEIDTSLPAARVVRALNELIEIHGKPKRLRVDNGPEFISKLLADWAANHGIDLRFIQPGKPTQNAYIEKFNRTYRTEVLDCYVFEILEEVRRMTEEWRHRYNHERLHESLGKLPPIQFAMAKSHLPLL